MALDYNSSPNMSLPVPITSYTTGPNWAAYEVTCFGILDGHSHTPGSGVPITPGAININSTLSFNNQYASNVGFLGLTINSATLSNPPNISGLYSAGANGELWYNDGNGHQVQITSGGNVDTSGSGGITGLASPASATYVAGTIKFQATATTPANLDFGSAVFRNSSSLTNGLTLSAPTLGSSYSLTLPQLPAANNTLVTINTDGTIGSNVVVDNSTIVISSNTLQVPTGGITAVQIASGTISSAQIGAATILGSNLVPDINLSGNAVQENGLNVIVSRTNAATNSLAVIRATVNAAGAVIAGEGISVAHSVAGIYQITCPSFLDTPVCMVCLAAAPVTPLTVYTLGPSTTGVQIVMIDNSSIGHDTAFNLIMIGQRT